MAKGARDPEAVRVLFLNVVSPRVRPASKYSRGRIGLSAGVFR